MEMNGNANGSFSPGNLDLLGWSGGNRKQSCLYLAKNRFSRDKTINAGLTEIAIICERFRERESEWPFIREEMSAMREMSPSFGFSSFRSAKMSDWNLAHF